MRVAVIATKRCTKCGRERSLEDFHKASVGAGGRQAKCVDCASRIARERYESKKSSILEQGRAYRETNREVVAERGRDRYAATRPAVLDAQRSRRARWPERSRARDAVAKAIRSGALVPAAQCACGGQPVEAHHESYERDRWLDVEWLCHRCHARRHGEERAA